MKKKFILVLVLIIGVTMLTGCEKEKVEKNSKESAKAFKEEYESLNGKTNSSGKEHRTISIDEDNPYEKVTQKKIVDKIKNKDTFYLYVGDSLCPWCRSVLEKSIEVSKDKNIKKIYYIDIWDEEGNEILRDKYELKDGKAEKVSDGTKEYERILKYFDSVLSDYTLTDEDGNTVQTGEKRIFAPNFFYIEKGKVQNMISGISEKQKDSREELTDAILQDEEKQFRNFFNN